MEHIIMRWSLVVGQIIWIALIIWRHEIMEKIEIDSTTPGVSAVWTIITGIASIALSIIAGTIISIDYKLIAE